MVMLHFVEYADYKTQVPALLGTGAGVKTFVRDGQPNNTGFEVLTMERTQQLALRFGAMTKPLTFNADFPNAVVVTAITVV